MCSALCHQALPPIAAMATPETRKGDGRPDARQKEEGRQTIGRGAQRPGKAEQRSRREPDDRLEPAEDAEPGRGNSWEG
nr:hypothetical protein GCM10010200_081700 [Actinomadura rugatobispora]